MKLCVDVGGVLTGEHGVGLEKRDLMTYQFDAADLEIQHRDEARVRSRRALQPGQGVSDVAPLRGAGPRARARGRRALPRTCRDSDGARGSTDATTRSTPRDAARRRRDRRLRADARRSSRSAAARSGRSASAGRRGRARSRRARRASSMYEPAELVLTAQAATPLATIEARARRAVAAARVRAAGLRRAARRVGRPQTIGGVLAANLAGSRRVSAGAARDHFLGFHAVSGTRRSLQGRRQSREERHGLRLAETARRIVGHARRAHGGHDSRGAGAGDSSARSSCRPRLRGEASRCSARRCARRTTSSARGVRSRSAAACCGSKGFARLRRGAHARARARELHADGCRSASRAARRARVGASIGERAPRSRAGPSCGASRCRRPMRRACSSARAGALSARLGRRLDSGPRTATVDARARRAARCARATRRLFKAPAARRARPRRCFSRSRRRVAAVARA